MSLHPADIAMRGPEPPSRSTARPVAILGSTGSIGRNVLDVIGEMRDRFDVVALGAGQNIELLSEQIARFQPRVVGVIDEPHAVALRDRLRTRAFHALPEIAWGERGVALVAGAAAGRHAHSAAAPLLVAAMVGTSALPAVYDAVRRGWSVALANKELVVAAGELVMHAAESSGAAILPIDSEPNAIHQCLRAGEHAEVERIILTASGGPFRELPRARLAEVTPEAALRHPTWKMGRRITIDSATLINKGFEIIEACHLFALRESQVEVVIHPQSIVHSLVEFRDGSVLAQMGVPDMRTPIQYALTFPERAASNRHRLRLEEVGQLDFFVPDAEKFPALRLARQALRSGGIHPTVLNAADEVAVAAFCNQEIRFTAIVDVVAEVLEKVPPRAVNDIDAVLQADAEARRIATGLCHAASRLGP